MANTDTLDMGNVKSLASISLVLKHIKYKKIKTLLHHNKLLAPKINSATSDYDLIEHC